jgi:hypothetical protein
MLRLVLLHVLLCCHNLQAQFIQNIDLKWGDLRSEVPTDPVLLNSFTHDDGYVVFRKHAIRGPGGFHYFIEKLDKQLNQISLVNISPQVDEVNYVVEDVFKFANNYYLLTSRDNRTEKIEEYYLQRVNDDLRGIGQRQLMYAHSYSGRRSDARLSAHISPSDSKLLLMIAPRTQRHFWTGKAVEPDQRTFMVYNTSMELVEKIENLDMQVKRSDYVAEQPSISDDGKIFMIGRKILETRGEEARTEVMYIEYGALYATEIKFSEGRLDELKMSLDKQGNMYCAGYYTENKGRLSGKGVVIMSINPKEGEIINLSTQLINQDLLMEGVSDRAKQTMEKRAELGRDTKLRETLYVRDIVNHQDGSASLIGEIHFVVVTTSTDANGVTTTRYTYHYKDVFATRISPKGEIISTVKIAKRYAGGADLGRAVLAFDMNNNLSVIFLDNRQNSIEIGPKGVLPYVRKAKSSALALVNVDQNGKQTREMLIDYSKKPYSTYRLYIFGRDLNEIEPGKYLVCTYFGKKKFGYLMIENKAN